MGQQPTFETDEHIRKLAQQLTAEYGDRMESERIVEHVVVAARGVVLLGEKTADHLDVIETIARHQVETYLAELDELRAKSNDTS